MAVIEFELDQYKKGNLIAWNISTQCLYSVNVKIYAGDKVYFDERKTTPSTSMQVFTPGNHVLETEDVVKVKIEVLQSRELKSNVVSGAISDRKARRVGYIYDICIEDSGDRDYNDVYVNIVGWKNQAVNAF